MLGLTQFPGVVFAAAVVVLSLLDVYLTCFQRVSSEPSLKLDFKEGLGI